MNQAEVHKLISALKFKVQPKPFKIKARLDSSGTTRGGDRYNLEIYRRAVTGLIVNERIELSRHKGMMVREYSERLIQEAINNGDTHEPTMELADFWLVDKPAIHKLFKITANPNGSLNGNYKHKCVLEIKGHPFPPLAYSNINANRKAIHNVLLSEAKREYRQSKNHEEELKLRETIQRMSGEEETEHSNNSKNDVEEPKKDL